MPRWLAGDGIDRFEDGQLRDGGNPSGVERVLPGHRVKENAVPIKNDVSARGGRAACERGGNDAQSYEPSNA
jgi:hypothetical protein